MTQASNQKHPSALYLLFFTEMWERFSYYGMRALLILFLTSEMSKGGFAFSTEKSGQIYGLYTGFSYLTTLLGGYIADRYLGFRRAVIIGGILMAIAQASLSFGSFGGSVPIFYLGLVLLVTGNGMFKPNISSMVGQLYEDGSPLKDSAYTIFYMGINIGAFLGSIICGYLGENVGWHYGFGAAGVGMVLGVLILNTWQKMLGPIGLPPQKASKEKEVEAIPQPPLSLIEKQRLIVVLVLSFFSIIFWLAFEQAGSSMNLFASRYTNRDLGFFEVPATWFQSVNAFFIFTLAPLFSILWIKLEKVGKNPNGALKFAIGLFLLGLGFVALVIGAGSIPQGATSGSVSMLWLVLAYLLHTMGELCLSPVGLSFVNKLSPKHLAGLMFGVWFLATGLGNYLGGAISGFIDKFAQEQSLSNFFLLFVSVSIASSFILFLLSPLLKKWMHGVK